MAHKYVKEDETFNTSRNGVVPKPTASDISNNKVLRADGSWVAQSGGGGGGSSTLVGLDDVDVNNLSDKDILSYNASSQKFKNVAFEMSTLKDVDLSNLSDGQLLKYDAQNQKWTNFTMPDIDVERVGLYTEYPTLTSGRLNAIKTVSSLSKGIYIMSLQDYYERNSNRSYFNASGINVAFLANGGTGYTDVVYDNSGYSTFVHSFFVKATQDNASVTFNLWGNGYSPKNVVISVYKLKL